MIHFEITKSPDLNVISTFKYFKNEIYLGKNALDLNIVDSSLKKEHLLLEIPENDLLIHPQKDVEFYLLNGKRATSIRKLKVGDEIIIGNTHLKILGYEKTVNPSKKEILDKKLTKLIESNSQRISVIEKITKLMK